MKQMFDYIAISKAIKTKRVVDLNIGVLEVQRLSGVSAATVSRMENGKTCTIDNVISICNWLQVSMCDFIVTHKTRK